METLIILVTGITWDNARPFYLQAVDVQNYVYNYLNEPVILSQEDEPCLGGFTRVTRIVYQLPGNVLMIYTPVYESGPTQSNWGALQDFKYEMTYAE
jgi:hypothetical protein